MITVIASITIQQSRIQEFLEHFKAIVPDVLRETGCIEYYPAVDIQTGLPPQVLDGNVVTIIEKWQSVAALQAHLTTPHMRQYQERVKELVASVSLKVLQAI